jgi:Domain of unknown function (DUF4180)
VRFLDHGDIRVLQLDSDGPLISTADDTSDLIGNAWSEGVSTIAIPVSRLDPEFFDLGSRKAGDITQKLVNYRLRLVVVGDVSGYEAASGAFRDYVWESNRGDQVWFVPDEATLAERLGR